jgi:hypothetical protein
MTSTNPAPVPLTLLHLQEIVRECTKDLMFARESRDFGYLLGVVTTYMHLDRIENGGRGHIWHLDDYTVELDQSGLVVTPRITYIGDVPQPYASEHAEWAVVEAPAEAW